MVSQSNSDVPVLSVENLAVSYMTRSGEVQAVRDVSFEVHKNETFGLVGESGCGKSTVAFSVVQYLGRNGKVTGGRVRFKGRDVSQFSPRELRQLRGSQIAMVYQDPNQALNPSLAIGDQLCEVLEWHKGLKRSEAWSRCMDYLKLVELPDPEVMMKRFSHQLSGGQQQRVVIAMSLLGNPDLLVLDEPTTALDVTVEAGILDLVAKIQQESNMAAVYITHDLGVVARVCDSVGVMYAGEIVERAPVREIFGRPLHPYTRGLIRCLPGMSVKSRGALYSIPGHVVTPDALPAGCSFSPRCRQAEGECPEHHPELQEVEKGRFVRCHTAERLLESVKRMEEFPSEPADLRAVDSQAQETILSVTGLKTYYRYSKSSGLTGFGRTRYVKAVDGVTFDVPKGATLGIVGESGCGKSTLARTIVGLEAPTAGSMELLGVDITMPVSARPKDVLRRMRMVFQNPDSTLNPSLTVGYQIGRPLKRTRSVPSDKIKEEVIRFLAAVNLNETYYSRFPFQLSGGEKQRVAIARSVIVNPEVVICDEPLSSLDVSIQAAILNLVVHLQNRMGITVLFISHDLSVVRYIADYVAVMYLGKLCEIAPTEMLYTPPYHPYTEALLSAVPVPDPSVEQKRVRLSGSVPSAIDPPSGCRFHTRCHRNLGDICAEEEPPEHLIKGRHRIYCHLPRETLESMDPIVMGKSS